jgi:predicted transcriptional regulator
MMNYHGAEASVTCTDNNHTVIADVRDYKQNVYLSVLINTVSVNMQYNSKHDNYVGHMAGMEFVSDGPKTY